MFIKLQSNLLKLHFGMGVPLYIYCIFSEHFSLKNTSGGLFLTWNFQICRTFRDSMFFQYSKILPPFLFGLSIWHITRNMKRAKKETGIRFHVVSTWNTRGVFVGGNVPPHKLCFQQHFYFLLYFYFIRKNIFACLFSVQ